MLRTFKGAGVRPSIRRLVREKFRCQDCETRKKQAREGQRRCQGRIPFNMFVGIGAKQVPGLSRQERQCRLSMVCWGVRLAAIVKTSTNVDPDAERTWKGFNEVWLRAYSPTEVVVTDQRSEFKGVFEQKVYGMSVFQQAANTEAAWENGPTERCHATIQEQYELARSFEPQTQANGDELIVQGYITDRRYHNRSGFSPCQRVFGITPHMPRSLTNDDALETSEVTSTGLPTRTRLSRGGHHSFLQVRRKQNRIARASAARSVAG